MNRYDVTLFTKKKWLAFLARSYVHTLMDYQVLVPWLLRRASKQARGGNWLHGRSPSFGLVGIQVSISIL